MFSKKDIIVLGMMIFALFLGAGNIIFPPMEGYSAGNHWATASLGFVITGVLMPFYKMVLEKANYNKKILNSKKKLPGYY